MLQRYFQKQLDAKVARGVIVIDKQPGVTSHDEVDRLRQVFSTRKVGHSGTLDPKVTGVLVCGLGRGTKMLEYVLLSNKVYDCEIIFHKKISRQDLLTVMGQFTGTISQLPPVKSSVKRVERERDVYGLELLEFGSNRRTAQIRCSVERGTYIRKLCHDMGQTLGVGAHMGDLRRIQAGPCSLDNSRVVSTQKLEHLKRRSEIPLIGWWFTRQIARYIDPIERIVQTIPIVTVDARLYKTLQSGADLFVPGVLGCSQEIVVGDLVQIQDQSGRLLVMGQARMTSRDMKRVDKGVAVEVSKVL